MSSSYNISNCVIVFINSLQRVIQRLVNHLEINSSLGQPLSTTIKGLFIDLIVAWVYWKPQARSFCRQHALGYVLEKFTSTATQENCTVSTQYMMLSTTKDSGKPMRDHLSTWDCIASISFSE